MDFTILEVRHFVSSHEGFVSRTVKDYELDMECASNRIYSYGPIHECRLFHGDILLRRPGGVVYSRGAQNTYLLTLDFSGTVKPENYSRNIPGPIQTLFKHTLINELEFLIHPTHIREMQNIYQCLISLPNRNSDAAKELVRELIYMLNAEIARKNYELLKPSETIVDTITTFMRQHLKQRITLDDLSSLVCLEKSYLSRLFRQEAGKPPMEMLIGMRLEHASDLVASTNLSISQIAEECGYRTVSFFIAEYKKRFGMTPEAHRRMTQMNSFFE